jgi:hypothetical protein
LGSFLFLELAGTKDVANRDWRGIHSGQIAGDKDFSIVLGEFPIAGEDELISMEKVPNAWGDLLEAEQFTDLVNGLSGPAWSSLALGALYYHRVRNLVGIGGAWVELGQVGVINWLVVCHGLFSFVSSIWVG